MPPLHPLVVHFPIVLVFVAGVFYIIGLLRDHPNTNKTGFILHAVALLGCVAAILTGDYEESQLAQSAEVHEMVEWHESLGMISTWAIGLLGVWGYLRQGSQLMWEKFSFLVAFWGVIGMLSYSAHVGGAMVYGHGVGIRKTTQPANDITPVDTIRTEP